MNFFKNIKLWLLKTLGLLPLDTLGQKWEANVLLHKQNKAEWDKEQLRQGGRLELLKEVYKSQSGNVYFVPTQYQGISHERFLRMERAQTALQWSFDDPANFGAYIQNLVNNIKRLAQDADASKALNGVLTAVAIFENNSRMMPKIANFCNLAACFMIRHDENPYLFDEVLHLEKMQELYQDSLLRSFFLAYALEMQDKKGGIWEKLRSFGISSTDDFQQYSALQTAKEKAEQSSPK